jgi:phosphoserine aminotransferase
MQKINEEKAGLLYDEIERNKLFQVTVPDPEDRSLMNVCFVMSDNYKELEKEFGDFAKSKGHGWHSRSPFGRRLPCFALQCSSD